MGMPKRVAVLIPQGLQLDFIQIWGYLRRKWITTYLGAFAQEIPKMVKAFLFNELIHHRFQGFRGISTEGILDEGARILIDINFGQVCRRLSDNSLQMMR
jgi:hypothetical protein